MLANIQLLRNIGLFDSITPGAQLPFARLSLVYAENGRGKTTLAAILRSLRADAPDLVVERRRLGAIHPPHVILRHADGGLYTFQDGTWSAALPSLAVFDDTFVAENVCAGIEIGAGQRQNLHELILGAQGVALNNELQRHVAAIEQHNRDLRIKENAIPAAARQGLDVDAFCALPADADLAAHIQEAERALAAARSAAAVQAQQEFVALELPPIDLDAINVVLARDLPQLDAAAAAEVQAHLVHLGRDAERWVGEGVGLIAAASQEAGDECCPFCKQNLTGIALIDHYRAYFGAAYAELKTEIETTTRTFARTHSGDVPAAFERAVRVAGENREFWARFTAVPELALDTAEIARIWKAARNAVEDVLARKQAAPLERRTLDAEALTALERYRQQRTALAEVSNNLLAVNGAIAIVKEQARGANVVTLTADLARLKAVEARHDAAVAAQCQDYLNEKEAKAATEVLRAAARAALDDYRQNVFPTYQGAINIYLQRLGAEFRISGVNSVNNRGGSSATYSVVIDNHQVALTADAGPSFRNTLSAGDRNTLALAFFFASLEVDPQLASKIVVIDDPMTSLDENRSLVTVHELRRLADRVAQVIVLSHSKPFLVAIWKDAPANDKTALRITRAPIGSTMTAWNVNQDSITEHDRRYARVHAYIQAADPAAERVVASDLRPMLEAFTRVAYPAEFPPGALLGPFLNLCRQRLGTANEIMTGPDIAELGALLDYANRFHHDTNPAWQVENINDAELRHFAERTLSFIRRR
ncbi:MAG: AAA family ATPase [Terriglobia bacterium]|nr:AAA family ATPase [Terriglobia bacterium]